MLTKAIAAVWRRMGTRGVIILLITASALALVLKSDFSTAIWGDNRESGLFVLVGLAGFGGAFVSFIWAGGFVFHVLVEWHRLRRIPGSHSEKQNVNVKQVPEVKDAQCSKCGMPLPTAALFCSHCGTSSSDSDSDRAVSGGTMNMPAMSAADQNRDVRPPNIPGSERKAGSSAPLAYLPNAVGAAGAVVGIIVSQSIGRGAEVITLSGKLAAFGFMVGYPIGIMSRALIIRLSKVRQNGAKDGL
jgi:hypothetical protein